MEDEQGETSTRNRWPFPKFRGGYVVVLVLGIQICCLIVALVGAKCGADTDYIPGFVITAKVDTKPITNTTTVFPTKRQYKVAIAIISAFDWQETPPFVSFQSRRQIHRNTWIKHPSVRNQDVLVYFVIGARQQRGKQGNPADATHTVEELQSEMNHYGDVVLLNSSDVHDFGKMNAWYEWASVNIKADYHMKLDDESYLNVDNLLNALDKAPRQKFYGGFGQQHDRNYKQHGTLKDVPWIRGWGYIMSQDLLRGLGECSSSKGIDWNDGSEFEDVYTAVALRVCGLDEGLMYLPGMRCHDLVWVLSYGCPKNYIDHAILLHGGMPKPKPFQKVPESTFMRLHDIYYPGPGDMIPSWAKWESLRLLYMNELRVCQNLTVSGWICNKGWATTTCVTAKLAF